jgi:hypothetical protein
MPLQNIVTWIVEAWLWDVIWFLPGRVILFLFTWRFEEETTWVAVLLSAIFWISLFAAVMST